MSSHFFHTKQIPENHKAQQKAPSVLWKKSNFGGMYFGCRCKYFSKAKKLQWAFLVYDNNSTYCHFCKTNTQSNWLFLEVFTNSNNRKWSVFTTSLFSPQHKRPFRNRSSGHWERQLNPYIAWCCKSSKREPDSKSRATSYSGYCH